MEEIRPLLLWFLAAIVLLGFFLGSFDFIKNGIIMRFIKAVYVFLSILIGKGVVGKVDIPKTGKWEITFGIFKGRISFEMARDMGQDKEQDKQCTS